MNASKRRNHNKRCDSSERWNDRRRKGFGMNLYRNVEDKKIAGVCAGIADHLNVDHWVIRLVAIGGLIFFNSLMLFAYIAAWIVLTPRPDQAAPPRYRYDENLHEDRPVNMFRTPQSPEERLKTAKTRMDDIVARASRMENYITSRRYEFDKEFSKIQE